MTVLNFDTHPDFIFYMKYIGNEANCILKGYWVKILEQQLPYKAMQILKLKGLYWKI